MDSYLPRRSPEPRSPSNKQEPRWSGREDDFYRRRSPAPYERRPRQRNRSRSPPGIDRYQPSDTYYGGAGRERDDRRRLSPTAPANIDRYVPGQEPKPILVNPVPDPNKLDYQVGFSYFGEWWRHNEAIEEEKKRQRTGTRRAPDRVKGDRETREERAKEKAQIQVAYDAYKEEMQVKMAKTFVQAHKGEEWFKERYVPETRDEFKQRLGEFRREYYNIWERDMENGTFDEFTLEGIHKGDSNGVGGAAEKEEGETTAAAEVMGVGDLIPSKGGAIRDEAAFQPALLIKTIAPTVSRGKIEEFCKEHLGESEGGFKWLSLSDPNPSKRYHRIGWVTLHPGSQADTERGDGRDEEDDERMANDAVETTQSTSEKALEAINGKTIHDEARGDFTIHVGVHAPPTELRKKALWDLFSAPERIEKDLRLVIELAEKFDAESSAGFSGVAKIEEKVEELKERGLLQPPTKDAANGKKRRKSQDVLGMDAASPEEGAEDEGEMEEDEEEEGAYDEEVDDEDLIYQKKKLDLFVEYLRRVYNFCFFCVFESDSVHELARKCPGGHLRRPRVSLNSAAKAAARASALGEPFPSKKKDVKEDENASSPEQKFQRGASKNEQQLQRAFNWVRTFEDKITQLRHPEQVDVRKLGGKPLEEAVDEDIGKYVKQEDENKFRCKVPECTKLFKGEVFWRKHVEKRHPEWLEKLKQDLNLVNNYVLDPSHIAPSRSDANSNGHFPNSNQFATGTPRGFSLNNMPMNFAPPFAGPGAAAGGVFPPGAAGFAPFFPNHAVQMPPNAWGAPGADFPALDDGHRHQPGPMRRGGQFRNNNNRQGPYDRRQRDGRDGRFGGGAGRLSPTRGAGPNAAVAMAAAAGAMGARMGAGGKWGDGVGGAAVGPREAVQGRSLKSYEDLDAVGGGGSGELNY
ncbi:MAG: hypothetical protein M1833_004297 [Piccolia ochrophora]|nr:MAG: hypothetical protein M1833_004297 [Piccolia ochrophora]